MWEDLMRISNLQVKPLYWIKDSQEVKESGAFCVSDGDRYFGTVGGRYQPMSYQEAYDFVCNSLGKKLIIVSHATNPQLSKGVITCQYPIATYKVGLDDVKLYLNIVNSLDGSTPIGILVTPVRVCCLNQFRLMKGNAFIKLNYRHTNHGLTLMQSQSSLLKEITDIFSRQIKAANKLALNTINAVEGSELIEDLAKSKIITERTESLALNIWCNPKRPEDQDNNEWVLFNAITEPINRHLENANRWSTVRELNRVGEYFAGRV